MNRIVKQRFHNYSRRRGRQESVGVHVIIMVASVILAVRGFYGASVSYALSLLLKHSNIHYEELLYFIL
jgi:hypothetical protein